MRNVCMTAVFGVVMVLGVIDGHAETWVKNNVDVPNKNLAANYYDADSVKTKKKTIFWTEKFVLTSFGSEAYTKHLLQYPACSDSIAKKGSVTHHKIDFEIKEGKFRTVAKRNFNKDDKLLCTDKDMGTEFDKQWHEIVFKSPMYERHYILVTKYKLGEI